MIQYIVLVQNKKIPIKLRIFFENLEEFTVDSKCFWVNISKSLVYFKNLLIDMILIKLKLNK